MLLTANPRNSLQEQVTSSKKWTISSQLLRARVLSQMLDWLFHQWEDSVEVEKAKIRA